MIIRSKFWSNWMIFWKNWSITWSNNSSQWILFSVNFRCFLLVLALYESTNWNIKNARKLYLNIFLRSLLNDEKKDALQIFNIDFIIDFCIFLCRFYLVYSIRRREKFAVFSPNCLYISECKCVSFRISSNICWRLANLYLSDRAVKQS